MTVFATRARLEGGWAQDVRLTLDAGMITAIQTGTKPQAGDVRVDTVLPALANLHSHSFQRAMAGMTEYRAAGRENFWTWRSLMYEFLDRLKPEHVTAVAGLAFMEMQLAGYASVGEFHYVHHQKGGASYDNRAELSMRIFEAAALTGIGLTHLPVLYTYAGTGGQALAGGQLRFGNSVAQFSDIMSSCRDALSTLPADCKLGIAPHSLRATLPDELRDVVASHRGSPVHIHIAEQLQEVEEVQEKLGARPVEWLLENLNVDARWCLIHATHMNASETTSLAKSGAVAGLCPVTEANLGDGIFNGRAYINAGGAFGIGTDSNVNISVIDELRMLEYSQRLRHKERNVMLADAGSVGEALYLGAAQGGAQALARNSGHIKVGALADLVAINANDPSLCALSDAQVLDGFIFAAKDRVVTDMWSAGRHQVQAGRHVAHDQIVSAFRAALTDLIA